MASRKIIDPGAKCKERLQLHMFAHKCNGHEQYLRVTMSADFIFKHTQCSYTGAYSLFQLYDPCPSHQINFEQFCILLDRSLRKIQIGNLHDFYVITRDVLKHSSAHPNHVKIRKDRLIAISARPSNEHDYSQITIPY